MTLPLTHYLTGPNEYLPDSYRLLILRSAITWLGAGMEIHNPFNSVQIWVQRYTGFKNSIFFKWILMFQ